MDSRERVFAALSFKEPDRVPVDFWASEGFYRALEERRDLGREEFLDRYDVDFRYIPGPRYIGPAPETSEDHDTDIWGVRRKFVTVRTPFGAEKYKEVVAHPLADARSVEDVEKYSHWPSPDWFDYAPVRSQCEAIRARGRIAVFMGDRLNRVAQLKPAMYLRGVERILLDLVEAPQIAEAIFRRIVSFYSDYLRRILKAAEDKLDMVVTGDDFGTQRGLLVSPGTWRRFLEGGFRRYIDICHRHGVRVAHHTCGKVTDLLPRFAECGLDVLQSLQPEAMARDFADIKRRYGRRLAFHGGVSIQRTLPRCSPAQVREEVRSLAAALAPGGGYVFGTAHNVQADCPVENVEALFRAYHEFGRYDGQTPR